MHEENIHQHHQRDGAEQGELHVVHRLADRQRSVVDQVDFDRLRQLRLEARHQRAHGIDDLHGVGVRLPLHRQRDRVAAVVAAGRFDRLEAVSTVADFIERYRRTVALADDDLLKSAAFISCWLAWMVSVWRGPSSVPTGVLALARRTALASSSSVMPRAIEQVGVGLHAHRESLLAEHRDLRHAVDGRQSR